MDRVPQGLLKRRDLWGDIARGLPDASLGHGDEVGEGSVAMDADDLLVLADVAVADLALVAIATENMALRPCSEPRHPN